MLSGAALPVLAQSQAPSTPAPTPASIYAIPVVPVGPGGVPATQPAATAAPVPSGLAEIIKAKFPLSVTRAEMGLGWRVVEDWDEEVLYTRGDTHWVAGQEYLVAYVCVATDRRPLSERDYVARMTGNYAPAPLPEDRFELVLVDMARLMRRFAEAKPVIRSYKTPVVPNIVDLTGRPEAYYQNLSLIYLGKLHEAMEVYSSAYLNTLPQMDSAFAVRQALLPFAENPAIFTQPGTKNAYKVNPIFSGQKRVHLAKQGQLVVFYEAEPGSDGMRAVLLYNGKARRVAEKDWPALKKLSRIP